ncbi:unnamed protein product [Zymoseptoria tritici ST99CH_3D1]|nr:unnamed protein product [Zymoseptoria tritici ST99CH_3D1]
MSTTTSSPPTSSSSWTTMDDSDSDATDATYSPSESSSTSSTSETPAWQIRSLLSEVECLKRDEYRFSRLPRRPPQRRTQHRRGWSPRTALDWVLLLALLSLILFSSCVGIPCLSHQHRQKDVSLPDFSPTVRPSDVFAMSKIAFQLPSRWMEWVALPPLGMSRLKDGEEGARYHLSVLQLYNEGWSRREGIRAQNRKSWTRGTKEVGAWLEKMEGCSPFLTTEDTHTHGSGMPREVVHVAGEETEEACKVLLYDPNGVKKLTSVVDDMLDHLRFELAVLDVLYLPTLANLSRESESQMRTLNEEVYSIAVEASERSEGRNRGNGPSRGGGGGSGSSGIHHLLSDRDKSAIAGARREYGLLSFLALTSHALPPGMRKRKDGIRALRARIEGVQARIEGFGNGSCTTPLCVTGLVREVWQRIPGVREWDGVLRERFLSASVIRRVAAEWMDSHTLQQQQQHGGDDALPKTAKSRLHLGGGGGRAWRGGMGGGKGMERDLYSRIWLDPTRGAASWHWEGSGSCPNWDPGCTAWGGELEEKLLYTDLRDLRNEGQKNEGQRKEGKGPPEGNSGDFFGLLGKGETWEDYRYRMMPRKDGADLRGCWPGGYGEGNLCG